MIALALPPVDILEHPFPFQSPLILVHHQYPVFKMGRMNKDALYFPGGFQYRPEIFRLYAPLLSLLLGEVEELIGTCFDTKPYLGDVTQGAQLVPGSLQNLKEHPGRPQILPPLGTSIFPFVIQPLVVKLLLPYGIDTPGVGLQVMVGPFN